MTFWLKRWRPFWWYVLINHYFRERFKILSSTRLRSQSLLFCKLFNSPTAQFFLACFGRDTTALSRAWSILLKSFKDLHILWLFWCSPTSGHKRNLVAYQCLFWKPLQYLLLVMQTHNVKFRAVPQKNAKWVATPQQMVNQYHKWKQTCLLRNDGTYNYLEDGHIPFVRIALQQFHSTFAMGGKLKIKALISQDT